jgi:transcriptional regulator with XRE-family HTH domain
MKFRELREAAGFTQEVLAQRAGVSQSAISQIEQGNIRSPQYATVVALAAVLAVEPADVAASIVETCEAA